MKDEVTVKAVVDRFEDGNAVLLVGKDERQTVFPAENLPQGLNEGDYIRMKISYDAKATRDATEESARLLNELRVSRS